MELDYVATLRCVIGMLGEKDRADWWASSFFSSASQTFITPLFPRTSLLARCQGVTAAATRVHDERIGVGEVFHLFRLPEDMERGIHELLQNEEHATRIQTHLTNADVASEFIKQGAAEKAEVGPTLVADASALRSEAIWQLVSSKYAAGLRYESQVFPYFTDGK